jgi:hypothetical protein
MYPPRSGLVFAFLAAFGIAGMRASAQNANKPVTLPSNTAPAKKSEPTQNNPPPTTPDSERTKSADIVEFEGVPLEIPDFGLSMSIPKASKFETNRGGGRGQADIAPQDRTYLIRVYNKKLTDTGLTLSEVADQLLANIRSATKAAKGEVLVIEQLRTARAAGRPAERLYVEVPQEEGKPGIVRGTILFKLQPGEFVFFDLITTRPEFEKSRAVFEACVSTAQVADPAETAEQIKAMVKTGVALLGSVSNEDLKSIVESQGERWERLSKPGPDGRDASAEELGYRRIRTSFGERGTIQGFSGSSAEASEKGYIVRLDSRLRRGSQLIDIQAVFFLSEDRSSELWTLTTALRGEDKGELDAVDPKNPLKKAVLPDPKKVAVYRETGARTGNAMNVSITRPDGVSRSVSPMIAGEGYLSRVESYLLPQILARKGVQSDFGFYTYQHDGEKISLRRDSFSAEGTGGKVYQLRTRVNEKSGWQTMRLRSTGELIELRDADGKVWEPTTLDKLKDLWRSKGLPLD